MTPAPHCGEPPRSDGDAIRRDIALGAGLTVREVSDACAVLRAGFSVDDLHAAVRAISGATLSCAEAARNIREGLRRAAAAQEPTP